MERATGARGNFRRKNRRVGGDEEVDSIGWGGEGEWWSWVFETQETKEENTGIRTCKYKHKQINTSQAQSDWGFLVSSPILRFFLAWSNFCLAVVFDRMCRMKPNVAPKCGPGVVLVVRTGLWTRTGQLNTHLNPSTMLGCWVKNRVLATLLVKWLSWDFTTHERKKERMLSMTLRPPLSLLLHPRCQVYHGTIWTYLFLHFKVHILKYTYICARTRVYSDPAPTNKICRRALYRLYIHIYM